MIPQETLKHSKADLAHFLVGFTAPSPRSWCTQGFVCVLQASLVGTRFDFKWDCTSPAVFVAATPLPLDVGYPFLVDPNILLPMVVQHLVAILVFLQEKIVWITTNCGKF